jgi:4-aminobutyrate aminotransferase-like enzyme/Ser/Thr protein kinase RdoA (MazF antagonist)
VAVFDFFAAQELIRPAVESAQAEQIAGELFGVTGSARELGSNQDRNYRITDTRGQDHLLKIDNSAFSAGELAGQSAALAHLAERGVAVPAPLAGRDGRMLQQWRTGGQTMTVRMFSFLDGHPLSSRGYLPVATIRELGTLSGTVCRELAGFTAEGLERNLQWDLRNAEQVVDRLIHQVSDPARRELVARSAACAAARLQPVKHDLRVQAVHGDITDDNVLCSTGEDGRSRPEAVIDFGDLASGWAVAELAVTVCSVLHHLPDEPHTAFEAVRAFHEQVPLTEAEIVALWPLVVLRGAVLVVSGEHQVSLESENHYAAERVDAEWRAFQTAAGIGWDEAEAAVRVALGQPPADGLGQMPGSAPLIAGMSADDYGTVDLGVTSPLLDDGRWLQPESEWAAACAVLRSHPVAVAPYGVHRLTRTSPLARSEVATVPLIVELFLRAGAQVRAPLGARVTETGGDGDGDGIVLAVTSGRSEVRLRISGIRSSLPVGAVVGPGDTVGTVTAVRSEPDIDGGAGLGRVRVQLGSAELGSEQLGSAELGSAQLGSERLGSARLGRPPGLPAPEFVTASWAAAWQRLCPDPSALIGLTAAPAEPDAATELARRARFFPAAQEKYYEQPPQFERGWREFLIDTTGRPYLDMVNNVTSIGHAHPRLASAVSRQLRLLNTNSRFLYKELADFSEKILALAPDASLDTVILVNSGTEAVDLALRMARIHTGRRDIVALREAYHGWSMAADAITTSAFDNPSALGNRPDWVHLADIPNPYRGKHRGPDAGSAYTEDVAELLDSMTNSGQDVAAFICEPVLGNAGGVVMPPGYLAAVYREVRRRGGLCIADEVQVGYGRLGEYFWGVQHEGVVPDLITIAKAMGGGYPLGAVITRREIADSLTREGNFFSSAGGSPASCVAGSVVLDVIADEGLQENARLVGAHLQARLQSLAKRHPLIGAVHGLGLYLGVELVRDRATLEPATAETASICERLLQVGVIMQPTSERQNVLKIKPPMCLTRQSADFFVDALDHVLTTGW